MYLAPTRQRPAIRFVCYTPDAHPQSPPGELRAVAFFRLHTSRELAFPFAATFWSQQVMLLGEHQPAVRHALIALGSVHEAFAYGRPPMSQFALHHYNKAVKMIMHLLKFQHPLAYEAASLTSIIFACLEALRGCYRSAMKIIASATRLLQERRAEVLEGNELVLPRAELCNLFTRLTYQILGVGGSEFDHHTYHHHRDEHYLPDTFPDLGTAMRSIETLYSRMSHLHRWLDQLGADALTSTPLGHTTLAEAKDLQIEHARWQLAFDELKSRMGYDPAAKGQNPALTSIEMINNVVKIMLSVNLICWEGDFDGHVSTFKAIVDQAEELIGGATARGYPGPSLLSVDDKRDMKACPPPPGSAMKPAFTLSTGCVGPLYFAAARCRDSSIRRRALALLQTGHRKEGFWDSRIAASIAEKVIKIEEASRQRGSKPLDVSPQSVPADIGIRPTDRVKLVDICWSGDDEKGAARYSRQYAGSVYVGERFRGLEFQDLTEW